jgi:hypothetical protein
MPRRLLRHQPRLTQAYPGLLDRCFSKDWVRRVCWERRLGNEGLLLGGCATLYPGRQNKAKIHARAIYEYHHPGQGWKLRSRASKKSHGLGQSAYSNTQINAKVTPPRSFSLRRYFVYHSYNFSCQEPPCSLPLAADRPVPKGSPPRLQ